MLATTFFHLEFSGVPLRIVSADGQNVEPVEEQRLLIWVDRPTMSRPGSFANVTARRKDKLPGNRRCQGRLRAIKYRSRFAAAL